MIFQVFPVSVILALFQTGRTFSEFYFRRTNSCVCGVDNEYAPRIVGGLETSPHKYPWAVAILVGGRYSCAASLINDRYIMSAGHCFVRANLRNLGVVLGSHRPSEWPRLMLGYDDLEYFVVHEDFTSDDIHDTNDIALIKLKKPVTFSAKVRPVCLPNPGLSYTGRRAILTGWGRIHENGEAAKALRETKINVISNKDCKNAPIVGPHITPRMLCAYTPNRDGCQGDSGGPLVYEGDMGRFDQIGVVSWGIGCARKDIPGIYTRVTDYLEWISLHTTDAFYCQEP